MAKIMIFVDGTWLYYSKYRLGELEGKSDFNVDYGRLPHVLCNALGERMADRVELDITRCYLFGSYAWNHDERDSEAVTKQRDFFAMLKERYHYEVEIFPIDFKGRRLRRSDRDPSDHFEPQEKCVDISLATTMMYYAAQPGAYDIAMIVAGDQDFVPLLRSVRMLGRRVAIASIRACCCQEFADTLDSSAVRDFETIWLDDWLDDLELQFVRKQLSCESPLHEGDRNVWTTFSPRRGEKFYCDDCRARFEALRNEREAEMSAPVTPLRNGSVDVGSEIAGFVKTKFPERGFGFIQATDGCDYFFHLSDLSGALDFEGLAEGTTVLFQVRKPSSLGKAGAAQNVSLDQPARQQREAPVEV